ncbi:hypothetical protein DPMN_045924 [Dreissena polymorpha]|uniref:Uncharacterized protein n=1 Tax=Dreissena polymorpha TaxID=45954 RepID=A0A9D4D6W3_DREPO|nr:hypothetical protein DPMN_045924 [Dreissena polymorpha]
MMALQSEYQLRCKQKHAQTKELNAWTTALDQGSSSTEYTKFSETLSSVLDYYAVNEHLLQFRRKILFFYERSIMLANKALGRNRRTFMLGSQMEGTTTLGMKSDVDQLTCFETFRVFHDSKQPSIQLHDHQVVIQMSTNGCASQYCVLTMIEPSAQASRFKQWIRIGILLIS